MGLVIAGPYEFLADDPFLYGGNASGKSRNSEPGKAEARIAIAAHNLLKADVGWISPKAARWLQNTAGCIPAGYHIVTEEPVAQVINTIIGAVGIILFPEGPAPGKGPTPEIERKVLKAGQALREKTLMVIGISPWGFVGERDFLPKAEGTFACILGSGEGVAFPHSLSKKNPGILWLRPDSKGRAVNVLEFLQLPTPGGMMQWREGITFNASLDFLSDSYSPSPEMIKIIGTGRADAVGR